jgi:superfamily II DNA or RNA helicase
LLDELLLRLARTPGGSEVLDMSCDELVTDVLDNWDAVRLLRRLQHVDTIGDALCLRLSARDSASLEEAVRATFEGSGGMPDDLDDTSEERPGPTPPVGHGVLAPGMDRDALHQWASANDVSDMLSLQVGQLLDAPTLHRTNAWRREQRVADAICARHGHSFDRWSEPTLELQRALIEAIVKTATATRSWIAHEATAESWRSQRPDHAVLGPVHEILRAERQAARSHRPPRGWHRAVELTFEEDPPAVVASVPQLHAPDVRLQLDLLPLIVTPAPHPTVRLAVADRLLDLLTSPDDLRQRLELERILAIPRWQRDVDALARAVERPSSAQHEDKMLLCWRVTDEHGRLSFEPARAARTKRGSFATRSASIADVADLLVEPVDQRIAELLATGDHTARLETFEAAVGHPRILEPGRGSGTLVPVRRGRLALVVRHEGEECTVALVLDGAPVSHDHLVVALEHNTRAGRVVFRQPDAIVVASAPSEALSRLAPWLARDARFPAVAHDALLDVVGSLSARFPVEVAPTLRGARLDGDPRPLLLLGWEDPLALTVTARVRPVPELPPEIPGEGSATGFVRRGDRRMCVERDLDHEGGRVRAALAPLELSERLSQGPFAWRLTEQTEALGVVERIQAHLPSFQVEWTGQVPRVHAPITASSLRLTVRQDRDWFGISGSARVASGAVDLEALLRTIEEGHDYVQIAVGTFARLDRALRSQLALLGGTAISPLLAPAVAVLEQAGAAIEAPVVWRDLVDRVEEARQLEAPVPEALRAELRDYQAAGFRWLSSLAHWAPGACLADDMGLGKTVQAIALLLRRAEHGPALVVAPASVMLNWEREIARFAPDLAVRVHHGSDRDVPSLGAGAVLLTTYGVLVKDIEALAGVRFATAVLDEAQAIKNPTARRSLAAFRLQTDFRLVLSGTPVENRVAEVWSLFRFVAPGLLGSDSVFRDRFVDPIEGRHDLGQRQVLAATIKPFVLRRTKEQVERELPPLTESVLHVQLSKEERTLYDTARARAVARMQQTTARDRGFRVLQELTTLRQLACHPRLVDPGSPIASSKLATLRLLLSDLREGGHRALVFSQFVQHLTLVREALDQDGVRYRYLDGSMTPSARRAEVDAFQSGSGDVFLISREAGGIGVNLTAADYVVHLDPWWNPAKEDQATDRAHRIGQDRPVTVYRLVAQGTIEERILELHAQKRELADALLAGTDVGERVSTAELLALLAGDEAPARETSRRRAEPTHP